MPLDYRGLILHTIGEMASRYGVSLRTLRFYEQRGLITPLRSGVLRLYTPHDEVRLQMIQKGKKFGFSLQEIENIILSKPNLNDHLGPEDDAKLARMLTQAQIEERLSILEEKRNKIARAIDELEMLQRQFEA